MTRKHIGLGAFLSGVGMGTGAWREPGVPPDGSINIDWYLERARQAEAAKLDFVFMVDSPYITPESAPHYLSRFEPLTALSAVAVGTSRIGLIGTLTTSYNEPFNVARQFGSLDLISHGRAGWNVVTTGLEGAAWNYGREAHIDHAVRYRRAREHVAVVQGLWDSYEDDAFPRDHATGVFLDRSRQHQLNHRGEFFSVRGPLNISRSPQGQPVIFQAGTSEDGRELAAVIAEGIFAGTGDDFDEAVDYYRDIKRRVLAAGRNPDHVPIYIHISTALADSEDAVEALREQSAEKVDLGKALVLLGRSFNYHDFTQYPLDGPFPDLGDLGQNGYRGSADRIKRVARERNFTVREAALHVATRRNAFIGTPEAVADEFERWFGTAVDGFIIENTAPAAFRDFVEKVVPILQARGLFREEYEHDTLRGHLGLPFAVNRYTKAREAHAPLGENASTVATAIPAELREQAPVAQA